MSIPFEQAYGLLRPGGTLVFVAFPADNEIKIPIFETVLNGIAIIGSIVGTRTDLRDVFELHAAGKTTMIRETRTLLLGPEPRGGDQSVTRSASEHLPPLETINESIDVEAGRSGSCSSPSAGLLDDGASRAWPRVRFPLSQ